MKMRIRGVTIFFILVYTGCALNSFTARIVAYPEIQKPKEKAILLLHGIFGSDKSFGKLKEFLVDDFPDYEVYSLQYWSSWCASLVVPCFQQLHDYDKELADRLIELQNRNIREITIVAHSMGGLISRGALVQLKKQNKLRARIKVILVGTPNAGSSYANRIQTILAPVTLPLTLSSTLLFGLFYERRVLWNNQLHDLLEDTYPIINNYLRDDMAQWHLNFSKNEANSPELYSINGVKDFFGQFSMTDGVVSPGNMWFGNVPVENQYYVPYSHDDEIYVEGKDHQTFLIIKKILQGDKSPLFRSYPTLSRVVFLISNEDPKYIYVVNIIPDPTNRGGGNPFARSVTGIISYIPYFFASSYVQMPFVTSYHLEQHFVNFISNRAVPVGNQDGPQYLVSESILLPGGHHQVYVARIPFDVRLPALFVPFFADLSSDSRIHYYHAQIVSPLAGEEIRYEEAAGTNEVIVRPNDTDVPEIRKTLERNETNFIQIIPQGDSLLFVLDPPEEVKVINP